MFTPGVSTSGVFLIFMASHVICFLMTQPLFLQGFFALCTIVDNFVIKKVLKYLEIKSKLPYL